MFNCIITINLCVLNLQFSANVLWTGSFLSSRQANPILLCLLVNMDLLTCSKLEMALIRKYIPPPYFSHCCRQTGIKTREGKRNRSRNMMGFIALYINLVFLYSVLQTHCWLTEGRSIWKSQLSKLALSTKGQCNLLASR